MYKPSFSIPVLNSNYYYRFGDAILKKGVWTPCRRAIINDSGFNGSLLSDYFSKFDDPYTANYQADIFQSVVEKQKHNYVEYDSTCKDTLYVNIRCGDILQIPFHRAKYNKVHRFADVKNLYLFNHPQLIKDIKLKIKKNSNINRLKFILAMHFGNSSRDGVTTIGDWVYTEHDENLNYSMIEIIFKKIKKHFKNMKLEIETNKSASKLTKLNEYSYDVIDEDFVKLCYYENILCESLTRASGFGKLIQDFRK